MSLVKTIFVLHPSIRGSSLPPRCLHMCPGSRAPGCHGWCQWCVGWTPETLKPESSCRTCWENKQFISLLTHLSDFLQLGNIFNSNLTSQKGNIFLCELKLDRWTQPDWPQLSNLINLTWRAPNFLLFVESIGMWLTWSVRCDSICVLLKNKQQKNCTEQSKPSLKTSCKPPDQRTLSLRWPTCCSCCVWCVQSCQLRFHPPGFQYSRGNSQTPRHPCLGWRDACLVWERRVNWLWQWKITKQSV